MLIRSMQMDIGSILTMHNVSSQVSKRQEFLRKKLPRDLIDKRLGRHFESLELYFCYHQNVFFSNLSLEMSSSEFNGNILPRPEVGSAHLQPLSLSKTTSPS